MNTQLTPRQRYNTHYKLRKYGNTVLARKREVIKRADEVSPLEQKWLDLLVGALYGVRNQMF